MSSIDEEIANRLKALKNESSSENTEKPKSSVITISSTRSSEEQVQELIKQLSEEADIDSRHEKDALDVDSEIRKRLDKLKCSEANSSGVIKKEISVKDIVNQYSSLAELESDLGPVSEVHSSDLSSKEEDELPWCVICNEDGKVKCDGCDDDIYCSRCFFEFHDKEDLESHHSAPFSK